MRSSAVITLFAASAAAQSSAVLLNPLLPAPTFTVLGSSSGTTTYVNSCSEGAGIPVSYLSSANTGRFRLKLGTLTATLTLRRNIRLKDNLFCCKLSSRRCCHDAHVGPIDHRGRTTTSPR